MIYLALNTLDTAAVEPLAAGIADSSAATGTSAPGAASQPFAKLMSDLLDGENSPFSQPEGSSAPLAHSKEAAAEQGSDSFIIPPTPGGLEDVAHTSTAAMAAFFISSQPPPTLATGVPAQLNESLAGGKPLPPSGSLLPPLPAATELAVRNMTATTGKTEQIATPPEAIVEIESERTLGSRLSSDRSLEFKSLPGAGSEFADVNRFQNESMLRERTFLQTLPGLASGFATTATNSDPSIAGMPNISHLSSNPGQSASTASVTPIFDGSVESQAATESRTALTRTEPVLREQLTTPFGNLRWHAEFAGKLRVLSQTNVSTVELNLNPAELGVIDIKIHSLDDGTVINFFSANPNTREVIDASLPRLRELLADSGIQLHHGDVSERSTQSDETARAWQSDIAIELPEELGELQPANFQRRESHSMIDHYV